MARKLTMLLAALGLSLGVTVVTTAPAEAAPQHRLWCC